MVLSLDTLQQPLQSLVKQLVLLLKNSLVRISFSYLLSAVLILKKLLLFCHFISIFLRRPTIYPVWKLLVQKPALLLGHIFVTVHVTLLSDR
jgi:hypothetical protein